MDDRRRRFVESVTGQTKEDLGNIQKVIGRWAYLAQLEYFRSVAEVIAGFDETPEELPPPDVAQRIADSFATFELFRKQAKRLSDTIDLFESANVPADFE